MKTNKSPTTREHRDQKKFRSVCSTTDLLSARHPLFHERTHFLVPYRKNHGEKTEITQPEDNFNNAFFPKTI